MARSERQIPSVYFGRPGAFVTLPWPRGDVDKSYERQVFDFLTGSGLHLTSLLPLGSRSFSVNWNALHVDNFNLVDQYWTGAMGVGPWAFVDPSMPNLLQPNQASATNATYDATGFSTVTGAANEGTLISNSSSSFFHRTGTQRSLRWQFTVSPIAAPTMRLDPPYRNWYGIPAVVGLGYTFSGWGRPDSVVDTAITMSLRMQWLDVTGVQLSETSSTVTNMNSGYVKLTASGTAPANTAYVRPVAIVDGTTVTTGGSVYIDELLLEQDTTANAWAPGTGFRAVEILSLDDSVTFETRMRRAVTMNLRELVA